MILCNFVGMKQTLPEIIKENKELHQILLAQDGGIMKYWAEHPEADFDVDLFEGYEKQITEEYLQANKQNRAVRSLSADIQREKSLDWYLKSKGSELKFFVAMRPALMAIDAELYDEVRNHIEIYMADAYKESRRRKWPKGIPALDFYNEVLNVYGPWGLSLDCLERMLQEYRGKTVHLTVKHFMMTNIIHQGESPEWKELDKLQTEFDIRMFIDTYIVDDGFKKLRQAVKEMIDNGTRGLNREERCAVCVEMAKEDMRKVNQFTRWVYNKTYPMKETKDGHFVPLITPEERHWLLNIMYENKPGATGKQKLTPMGKYYSRFISILGDIGRIWAAQLLVHGTDMKQLEEENGIVLSRLPGTMYYVDGQPDDRRGDCCVIDMREAAKLLKALKGYEASDALPQPSMKNTPSVGKQPRKKGRKKQAFEDFVHKNAPANLMPILEELMDGASGRKALTIILSITGVYIDEPTNRSICKRFNTVGETAYGEAKARHEGTTYGKKDFSMKPQPISEAELNNMRESIKEKLKNDNRNMPNEPI